MQRVPPVLREQARGRVLTSNLISWLGAALPRTLGIPRSSQEVQEVGILLGYRPQKPCTEAVPRGGAALLTSQPHLLPPRLVNLPSSFSPSRRAVIAVIAPSLPIDDQE